MSNYLSLIQKRKERLENQIKHVSDMIEKEIYLQKKYHSEIRNINIYINKTILESIIEIFSKNYKLSVNTICSNGIERHNLTIEW